MVGEVYLSDNSGNRTPGHPHFSDPVPISGVTLNPGKGTVAQMTVVGGQIYVVTTVGAFNGVWFFSITGVCTAAANIEWVCPHGNTIIIKIPQGVTILHYYLDDIVTGKAYVRTLKPEN